MITSNIDLDTLSQAEFDALAEAFKAAQLKRVEARKTAAIEDLKKRIAGGDLTAEDVVEALGGTMKQRQQTTKYVVTIDNEEVECSPKALPKKVTDSEEFNALPESEQTPDAFLRARSEQYRKDYAENATYKGKAWYMNLRGTLNSQTQTMYEQWLNDSGKTDSTDNKTQFKQVVMHTIN